MLHYGRDRRRETPTIGFNATPMIDVIFLLTIFFMLVTRFSSAEQIPMDLPKPARSQAKVTRMPDRVVINCRLGGLAAGSDRTVLYSIGPNQPESLAVIADRLAALKSESPSIKAVVRADRRLHYVDVRAVMQVVAECGIEMFSVVAHVGEEE